MTDAMAAMGLCEGTHALGAMAVEVKNKTAHVAGTNTLAGRSV